MPQDPALLRKNERFKGRFPVQFDYIGVLRKGTALNFSSCGLFIQSEILPDIGSDLRVICDLGKSGLIVLNGKVVWTRHGHFTSSEETEPRGFGVNLIQPGKDYLTFVQKFKEFVDSRQRKDQRIDLLYKINYKSGYEFLTEYCENLSKGGLYLASKQEFKKDQTITLVLEIPGIEKPLSIEGKVMYYLSEEESQARGHKPGAGIQFVNLSPEASSHLENFIKRLQIHRQSRMHRNTGVIPHQGKLQDYLVPEILIHLFETQATGQLHLDVKGVRKTVYIKNGRPMYVSSPIRSESFGHHLLRMGVIEESTLHEISEDITRQDFKFGEALLQKRYIDPASLAQFLVSHQEEKLSSTFQYFDGNFQFQSQTEWPSGISFFPLRMFHVLFSGAHRWYNEAIIQAWTGIHTNTTLKLRQVIPNFTEIPPNCLRMLNILKKPRTVQVLSETLKMPFEDVYPILFIYFLAGWIEVTTEEAKKEVTAETLVLKPTTQEKLLTDELARTIEEDYQKIVRSNFFQVFDITPSDSIYGIENKYFKWLDVYQNEKLVRLKDPAIIEKANLVSATIKIAYETIKDSYLRQLYVRRSAGTGRKSRQEFFEADLIYMQAVQLLEQKQIDALILLLGKDENLLKKDASLLGLYAWALFQKDSKKNFDHSLQQIESAISKNPADAQLRFFRGKLYEYNHESDLAVQDYEKALELQPNFMKAEAARDQLVQQQQITKITSMNKKKK